MTTIAADARAGVMVCDSKCTSGETWFPLNKVQKHNDELIGYAGDVDQAMTWLDWYTRGKNGKPPKSPDCEVLILRRNGVFWATGGREMRVSRGFHAIGTGGAASIAVMLAGHPVRQAVRIALQVDAGSGGAIRTHRLVKKSSKKGKR